MSTGAREERELLILLEGPSAPKLRRLAALWPRAAEERRPVARLSRWATLSGLPISDVKRLGAMLLGSGLALEDGTLRDDVAELVSERVSAILEKVRLAEIVEVVKSSKKETRRLGLTGDRS